eukprot:CAMPEP_0196653974 /NCGR_PEP_ID=MMETSP1086-20130531/3647_1 /TAXON_ID=77921 /ORGANISM="Cyanoptyche  gloeocystis , Strain SAG4.97" /LENGTH=291 /DNA_ID=CAMNT_0041985453 /DNA_START=63 /DNA_END=938 /DNA_ORIENTATION=-
MAMSQDDVVSEFQKLRAEFSVRLQETQQQLQETRQQAQETQHQLQETQQRVEFLSAFLPAVDSMLLYNGDQSSTNARSSDFKKQLINLYSECTQSGSLKLVKCSITRCFLPKKCVIASHIFKRTWAKHSWQSVLLGFNDIDDPRNGLLLFKPFEYAFDRSQICFTFNSESQLFIMKILDSSIKDKVLVDNLFSLGFDTNDAESISVLRQCLGFRTFGDFDGSALLFSGLTRPFKRALCFHAHRSRKFAVESGWLSNSDFEFEDFWSESDYKVKISRWLRMLDQSPPAGLSS